MPILEPGANWEYTFTDPTGDASWNTTTGGWDVGAAPFGNVSGSGYLGNTDFNYNTFWDADGADGDDLWVRTTVNLAGIDLATVAFDLGVDNGFALYANGNLVDSGVAEGFTYRWEYSGDILAEYLTSGDNVIAVALEDHGSKTAFDMQITGDPTRVPDAGSSLLLMGLATLGLLGFRRDVTNK